MDAPDRPQAGEPATQATSSLDAVDPPTASGTEPDAVVQERAVADVVRHALGELRTDDRRLLELRYLAGWSNAELANLLAVSNGALRKRLHDARQRLRPHLEHLNQEITMTDYTTYLDQTYDASLQVPAAPALRRPDTDPTTTGLKVIDTMAPVQRGGTIEMVGPPGTGQLVIALELLYRPSRARHAAAGRTRPSNAFHTRREPCPVPRGGGQRHGGLRERDRSVRNLTSE